MEDYFVGKNKWFTKFWENKIDQSFALWWKEFYGLPDDYDSEDEYFTRMAFAFMGWSAFSENISQAKYNK